MSYNGEYVSIFIPKYKELLDESTLKKLREHGKSFRNCSGTVPKSDATDKDKEADKEADKDKEIPPLKKGNLYSDDFLLFYEAYPNKKAKKAAWERWAKMNGSRPDIDILLTAIKNQIEWRTSAKKGEFRPEWKHPATWLSNGCWDDETTEDLKQTDCLAYAMEGR